MVPLAKRVYGPFSRETMLAIMRDGLRRHFTGAQYIPNSQANAETQMVSLLVIEQFDQADKRGELTFTETSIDAIAASLKASGTLAKVETAPHEFKAAIRNALLDAFSKD